MPKQALVLYSSVAGSIRKLHEQIGQIVEDLCENGDYVANVRPLKPGMRGADIYSEEIGKIDLVISAGGDGTLRHTLGGAAEVNLQAPIGIVPLGTGNLLAKNLGVYKGDGTTAESIDYALDIIKQGHSVPLDLGKANDDYFIVAAGAGPIATAIARPGSQAKRSLKMFAYTMPLLKIIFRKEVPFKIVADGKTMERTAGGIFVSNASDMGIGCNLNASEYNDGYFDLCIFSADDLIQGMKIAFRFGSCSWLV
jgi:Sphingosine kinase and enzymes related to eukaryotic diacylglycerol kinase